MQNFSKSAFDLQFMHIRIAKIDVLLDLYNTR